MLLASGAPLVIIALLMGLFLLPTRIQTQAPQAGLIALSETRLGKVLRLLSPWLLLLVAVMHAKVVWSDAARYANYFGDQTVDEVLRDHILLRPEGIFTLLPFLLASLAMSTTVLYRWPDRFARVTSWLTIVMALVQGLYCSVLLSMGLLILLLISLVRLVGS
jgi:hypothetical protein